ncbi:Glycosyl transferase family 2 [Pseudoxanthomonas sp. GM95]|uniref:glycosyltransferase family 2 protein n=1 Tax=Pseudoxanthomonas sp. GM95 TaxID=1881043 RepID=UPI0008C3941E|nr:glycosyltransferase family 2 protein [Pseudoxanthomonas sp. GM95]SEL09586.1 Glycosyl transferase family 2 [Pseudoxanthomonas sp. GM95]
MQPSVVSVVMPVYNAEAWLRHSIDSVLQQTHAALELIAIDDGSIDRSWEILQEAARDDARIKPLQLARNAGVAAARNAGLAAANGGHVAFLDSDDWWHPRKLEWQLGQMIATGAQVSYGAYDRVSSQGRLLSQVRPRPEVDYRDMLRSNHIGHLTGMYARNLGAVEFQRVGHEDYVFWLDLVRRAGHAICIDAPTPLASYLVREGSVSSNKLRAAAWQWQIYRRIERLGLLSSAIYMSHYAWHAVHKRK